VRYIYFNVYRHIDIFEGVKAACFNLQCGLSDLGSWIVNLSEGVGTALSCKKL
jgi:hypothetical protein